MSANFNILNPNKPKRVLMLVANPAVSAQTGWPIGAWIAEISHPYWAFVEQGYQVDIVSPDGGKVEIDGFSDPRHESGYSAADILSLGFLTAPHTAALLDNTSAADSVNVAAYDALFLAGGQSPMYTFAQNPKVHKLVLDFWQADKVVAIVCHATSVLLHLRLPDGKLLVDGRTWTGFADAEEQFADNFVGMKIQPYWIESEARKLANTNFVTGGLFRPFAVRDGRLITGQQQFSGAPAAELVIEALGA